MPLAFSLEPYTPNMPQPNNDERLEKIEATLAHMERLLDQLNQVAIEQSATIRRLQTQQQRMATSLETAELERIKSTNTKPPHYQ